MSDSNSMWPFQEISAEEGLDINEIFGTGTPSGAAVPEANPFQVPQQAVPAPEAAPPHVEQPPTSPAAPQAEQTPAPQPAAVTIPPATIPAAEPVPSNPLEAAFEAKTVENAKASLFEKKPVFCHKSAKEVIEDPTMTFEELRIRKSEDFLDLEEGKNVSWSVEYGTIRKDVKDPKGTTIISMKESIERSREFLDALKKAKDKNPDCIVRPKVTIFQLKMEGYSQQAIANYLSSEGVLPPAAYKQQQGLKYQSGFQAVGDNNAWSPVAVRAILENPIYIGTLVQGKRGTPNYKIKQMKLRSKEDWCIVEKNHAPIISEELFTSVQHLLSLDTRTSPSEQVVQPLAGMLYCADCGRTMCRRSVKRGNRTFYYYVCSTHKRSKLCSSHSVSQTVLENVVLRAIQKQIEMVVDIDQLIHEIGQKSIQAAKHRQLDITIEEKEKQITEQKEYRMRLLEAFHDDLISRTEYDMMRQRYTQRIDALQAALVSLHERRQALEEGAADTRNWVAEYTKFRKIDKLTREMVAGLIRRITVSEGKQITIQFNYADELASYQQMIAAATKEVG